MQGVGYGISIAAFFYYNHIRMHSAVDKLPIVAGKGGSSSEGAPLLAIKPCVASGMAEDGSDDKLRAYHGDVDRSR